jgi:hypothetical protein
MTLSSKKSRLTKYSTDFGASVSSSLAEARMTQIDLAAATNRSVAYTNQVITGRKPPTEEWVNLVANCLNLPVEKKQQMLVQANDRRKRSKFVLPPYKSEESS